MKLITKINDKVSIWANEKQYAVKVQKGENSKPDYWYLSGLDACFLEVFDYLTKTKLADGKNKTMKEIAQIIVDTREKILKIMAPFKELDPKK